jgi:spermine oxidase
VVVGAGIAGLSAAVHLIAEHGFRDVRVVEAAERPGGRIRSLRRGPGVLELGAQFVHGRDTPIYRLACEIGAVEPVSELQEWVGWEFEFLQPGGRPFDAEVLAAAGEIYTAASEELKTSARAPNAMAVFDARFAAALAAKRAELSLEQLQQLKRLKPVLHKVVQLDKGCEDWARLSPLCFSQYEDCPEEEYICFKPGGRGFESVVEALLGRLPPGTVQLGRRVERIEWERAGSEAVRVVLADGSALECEHAVVTCSLGVLKRSHAGLFRPGLPADKVRAVEAVGE